MSRARQRQKPSPRSAARPNNQSNSGAARSVRAELAKLREQVSVLSAHVTRQNTPVQADPTTGTPVRYIYNTK